jgi:GxxExxY protein
MGYLRSKKKLCHLYLKRFRLDCGYRLDLLVEIKSVELLNNVHLAQTLTYLKPGGFKLGLLMNFNVALLKNGVRRVVNNL